jgi:hypothetical protein
MSRSLEGRKGGDAMKKVIMAVAALLVVASGLVIYTAVTHTKTAVSTCGDPRFKMFCSSWVGSSFYVFDKGSATSPNPALANSTINKEAGDLRLNVVRYEMLSAPCAITDDARGCTTTEEVADAIDRIQEANLNATPLVVLPPVVNTCPKDKKCTSVDTDQCDTGDWAWDGDGSSEGSGFTMLAWDEWLITEATIDGAFLFELANEPDNYCGTGMQSSYGDKADPSWACTTHGDKQSDYVTSYSYENLWDCVVPALRAYARANDLRTFYIGGPAWSTWDDDTTDIADHNYTASNLWDIEEFVRHEVAEYKLTDDSRIIPDFVSVHTYLPVTPRGDDTYDTEPLNQLVNEMATPEDLSDAESKASAQIATWSAGFDDLQTWMDKNASDYSIGGEKLNDYIKVVDSEYNDTPNASDTVNTGQAYSQDWCDWYYTQMFKMFNRDNLWGSVQSALSGGNAAQGTQGDLNLIDPLTGDENDCYSSFHKQA